MNKKHQLFALLTNANWALARAKPNEKYALELEVVTNNEKHCLCHALEKKTLCSETEKNMISPSPEFTSAAFIWRNRTYTHQPSNQTWPVDKFARALAFWCPFLRFLLSSGNSTLSSAEDWLQFRSSKVWGRLVDGRVAGHLGDAVGLKTLSIHVCICPHFGM